MIDWVFQMVSAFGALFMIMDPFVSLPVLLSLTQGQPSEFRRTSADKAVMVAGGLVFVFLFFGMGILNVLGISISSFKIAGGIILMLLGLELVLNFSFSKEQKKDVHAAAIVIGTPLITGPGVITTTILFVKDYGYIITVVAAVLAILATWIILRQAERINTLAGPQTISVFSRIMGMMLVAMAIGFITGGLGITI